MIDVKPKSRINLHWKVTPYDYTKEKANSLAVKLARKYSIPREKVKVIPEFVMVGDDGKEMSVNTDIIQNIQDPQFQLKLFRDWLRLNNITDYDFELIKKIDTDINGRIDYQVYDKYRRYSIKWIRWSNFLSYGTDNYFDFTSLAGLVLLSGEPANQSGKTTFAIDLLHFLLFGKTTKVPTLDKVFNKHLSDATKVTVEGCINIDGEDYIIRRILSRPSLDKRTTKSKTTQKVEYFKIVGSSMEELEDYVDNQQEENSIQTNKVIKEAIGRESDFDLIISITESSLDDLVNKKEAERGRLLARWIGLLPIEQKDIEAREKYNSQIKPSLWSNQYDQETLKNEIEAFKLTIKGLEDEKKKCTKENKVILKAIANLESNKNALMASRQNIDENLLKIDITTLEAKLNKSLNDGKVKKAELDELDKELNSIGEVDFSIEQFDNLHNKLVEAQSTKAVLAEKYKGRKHDVEHLKSSEICPTCGRKLDNVDNSAKIAEITQELAQLESQGKQQKALVDEYSKTLEQMKAKREMYMKKNQLTMKRAALELNLEKLRSEYKEYNSLKKEYQKNSEAIDKNNALEIQIRNTDAYIKDKRNAHETNLSTMARNDETIKGYNEQIAKREEIIKKIQEEDVLVKHWKLYLEMVGKNGISKMVLRKTLPIINARLSELLGDVCDFDVEVGINAKNEVMFYLVKDGVYSDLASGSGFELTASALALRAVLADMSTIPRCNCVILDEITGRVSQENFDNVKHLLEKIAKSYDFIWIISHNAEIKSWCDTNIVVKKTNNVSHIVSKKLRE